MSSPDDLARLEAGVDHWNAWCQAHPTRRPDLRGAALSGADLPLVNLCYADLRGADLSGADLRDAEFYMADLSGANLEKAKLWNADLGGVTAIGANFREAEMLWGNLSEANFTGAHFTGAILEGSNLSESHFEDADLTGCFVYAISAWALKTNAATRQEELTITRRYKSYLTKESSDTPPVRVDHIRLAQYAHLILSNADIKDFISTMASKSVLILGRFYGARKEVLERIRHALRDRGFLAIIFDWDPSPRRDLTETVQLLANMSRFVVADVTDARSIPHELSFIIPYFPSVPVLPLCLAGEAPYAMFEHWRKYPSVLPERFYDGPDEIIDNFEEIIIEPVELWEIATTKATTREAALRDENRRLRKELKKARRA